MYSSVNTIWVLFGTALVFLCRQDSLCVKLDLPEPKILEIF